LPNIASYWFEPAVVLPTTPGMHRIAWDLRYPLPAVINYSYFGDLLTYTEYTLNVHSIKGHTPRVQPTGPLVVPGTYRVQLRVGDQTTTQELTVTNDPRIPVSDAALTTQLRLEQRMMAGMAVSFAEFNELQHLRAALAAEQARLGGSQTTPLLSAIRALDDHAAALTSAPDGSGFGPANRDLTRHLEDMEFGDIDPTPSDVASAEPGCRAIDAALTGLQGLETNEVPKVNALLADAHQEPLPTATPMAAPACGGTP
jgi:hypothetical protein